MISLIRKPKHKGAALLETVRRLALKQQKAERQPFLSLREAAKQFGVPVSAMAAVYRELTKERLLVPIRGSGTMLAGRGQVRTVKMRGMIGVPLAVRRFAMLQEYQTCFLVLQEHLRRQGYGVAPLLMEGRQLETARVISRLEEEGAEQALWLVPDGADREAPLRLRDHGIGFIGINFAEYSGVPCRYHVRRGDALRTILRAWRERHGLRGVAIARTTDEEAADAERAAYLRKLVQAEGFDVEMLEVPTGRTRDVTEEFCARRRFGMFVPGPAAALLARFTPELVHQVLATCRVAFIDGPLHLPGLAAQGTSRAELITVDWAEVGARVADEIAKDEAQNADEAVVFEAQPLFDADPHAEPHFPDLDLSATNGALPIGALESSLTGSEAPASSL